MRSVETGNGGEKEGDRLLISNIPQESTMLNIYVVSDATGETAERMIRAALVQFRNAPANVIRQGQVRTAKRIRELVREAARQKSVIVHTLVSDELRRLMLRETRSCGVDSMDLMGPVLDRLVTHLKLAPRQKPGLLRQLVEARSREINAVEYAFRHDDGQHPEELGKAEVVLVGVSRSMKTPVMLYLAYRGWFAANVPIILEVAPPPDLFRLPPRRVFCLLMAPDRLLELRHARADSFNIPDSPYTSADYIRREILHARRLSRDHGWRQIEVAGKSVEEVAREIITLLRPARDERMPAW